MQIYLYIHIHTCALVYLHLFVSKRSMHMDNMKTDVLLYMPHRKLACVRTSVQSQARMSNSVVEDATVGFLGAGSQSTHRLSHLRSRTHCRRELCSEVDWLGFSLLMRAEALPG